MVPHSDDLPAHYQQYRLIKDLEILVSNPLNVSQDTQSREMQVTGSATLYPGIIPNRGDVFLADLGDGRAAHFSVTNVERKSVMRDTVYTVDYVLKSYVDDELHENLAKKTIQVVHWVRDYLQYGQNPQVLENDFHKRTQFDRVYRKMVRRYFDEFYSDVFNTVILPDQTEVTYDPFLVNALVRWFDTSDHPCLKRIRRLDVRSDPKMQISTIWNALDQMDVSALSFIGESMGLMNVRHYLNHGQFGGVYWSGVQRVVYPKDPRVDVHRRQTYHGIPIPETALDVLQLDPSEPLWSDVDRIELETDLPGLYYDPTNPAELPVIRVVDFNETYLLSKSFYRDDKPLSVVERLVYRALNRHPMSIEDMQRVVDHYTQWNRIERFYYLPMVLAILKTWLRSNP